MKNSLQIVLLVLVFAVCAAGGYVLGKFLKNVIETHESNHAVSEVTYINPSAGAQQSVEAVAAAAPAEPVTEIVQPEEPRSAVPVIDNISSPKRNSAGKYSFEAKASVPGDDQLEYVLFADQDANVELVRQDVGTFVDLEPSQSGVYYLAVQNTATQEWSEMRAVKGFVKPVMYEKVTIDELQKICNSGDYGTAPDKYSHRFAPGFVIVANGMHADEKAVKTIPDICLKVMMGTWRSISIESIDYDSQNRVKKLVFNVNY